MVQDSASSLDPKAPDRMRPIVCVHAFGAFRLTIAGAELEVRGAFQRKPLELLKAIVALGGRNVEVARLLDLLWPDSGRLAARRAFDTALHRLRKLAPSQEWVVLRRGSVSLDPEHVWIDVEAFERAVQRVERSIEAGDGATIKLAADDLLDLYRGEFLAAEIDQSWIVQVRDRERSRFLGVLAGAGACFEAERAWGEAEKLYRRALATDNLSEPFYRGLIVCLLARGEPAEALNTFLRCRQLLSIVLNLQPGAETLALVRDIYDAAHLEAPLPGKPSIAVLPFANLSAAAEQEFFVDGLVEDVITALSRFHSLLVIARNSSFAYRGKATPVRTVARELGVRYVLEGSIRRAIERVRISVQLVDCTTGAQLWAETYDRAVDDIFEVQEELTQSIVMAIAPQIDSAEREKARRRRPENLSAYEFAIRARALSLEAYLKSDAALREQAIGDAKRALDIKPESSIALNVLARLRWQQVLFGSGAEHDLAWREGVAAATKAIEVDRQDEQGHSNLGLLLSYAPSRDRTDEALDHVRYAIGLNPNSVNTLNALAFVEVASGNPESAFGHIEAALRLSPRDPLRYSLYLVLAMASCSVGRFEHGVACALLGLKDAPGQAMLHVYLAANYVGLNRLQEAKDALRAADLVGPGFVQRAMDGALIYRDPVVLRRVTTFLRVAAGLDDASAAAALR